MNDGWPDVVEPGSPEAQRRVDEQRAHTSANGHGSRSTALADALVAELPGERNHGGDRTSKSSDVTTLARLAEIADRLDADGIGDMTATDPALLWDARPVLAHIRTAARARRVSPMGTLGAVLARVLAATPPGFVLPATVGGYASLNLLFALTTDSGGGKGSTETVAAELAPMADPSGGPVFFVGPLGSGEGLAATYVRRTPATKDGPGTLDQYRKLFYATTPEVDTLGKLGERGGSTLLAEVRKAYSGEQLGFGYRDPTKNLAVAAHSYRFVLTVGVQPKLAGILLDGSDAGTPQRFVWLPLNDVDAPTTAPPWPGPLSIRLPRFVSGGTATGGKHILDVCDAAVAMVDQVRLAVLRRELDDTSGDPLEGHALLTRLKVGAAFGLLDGRASITDQDWWLAGLVMAESGRVRAHAAAAWREVSVQHAVAAGRAAATVDEMVEEQREARDARKDARVTDTIIARVEAAGPGGIPHAELRNSIAYRDRRRFDDVIEAVVKTGQILAETVTHKAGEGVRYIARPIRD